MDINANWLTDLVMIALSHERKPTFYQFFLKKLRIMKIIITSLFLLCQLYFQFYQKISCLNIEFSELTRILLKSGLDTFIFSLSTWFCDPGFMLILLPYPELWQVLQRRDFNKSPEMKNKPVWVLTYIWTVDWVSDQLFVLNKYLAKVKKVGRLWEIERKLSGMFFQRAKGKSKPTSPFNRCTTQETRNRRFTWKGRKINFCVPYSPFNSEDLNWQSLNSFIPSGY